MTRCMVVSGAYSQESALALRAVDDSSIRDAFL